MAMEKLYSINETHTRSITALGFNPSRREVLMGCEDGVIKIWESENGKLISTNHDHQGWVTDFLFWPEPKFMFSSANDGVILVWASGGGICNKILVGAPVYCMVINPRRQQIICGVNPGIKVYELDIDKESGNYIRPNPVYVAKEHTDIVPCLICHESRVYSAGYDQRLVIYDSSYTGDKSMEALLIINSAHDAGISCLQLVKDNENNTWVVTGSFDKTVKIWSPDGKMVHKLDGFLNTVTDLCYLPRNKTIWVAGGASYAYLFDPKSGENVSNFIGTFQEQEEDKYHLQILKFFPEINQVIASTSRRHLLSWKYNPSGCLTTLKCKTLLDSLTYTKKVPLLLFSGDNEGVLTKWERLQSNHFMYSKENYLLSDAKKARKKKQTDNNQITHRVNDNLLSAGQKNKKPSSHYAFNRPFIPPASIHKHQNTTILKVLFEESLDLILAACEDSCVYVWGFDESAVKVLNKMKPPDHDATIERFSILLDPLSDLLPSSASKIKTEEDSVTNRVAGFICRHIFDEHTSCVTSMAIVSKGHHYDKTYLITAGWDRRICVWDLEEGMLQTVFRNAKFTDNIEHVELACDGVITDLCYSSSRNEFAYSSADKMIYIRQFSPNRDGTNMTLLNTLQGHYGEVTCVCWNPIYENWVTGSEDGTLRIWSGEGVNDCKQVLSTEGTVTALCIDKINGAIIAAIQKLISVYEPDSYRLVQTNRGHSDSVRCIIHITERHQYISCSWDKTIRVWNSWYKPMKRNNPPKEDVLSAKHKHSISVNNLQTRSLEWDSS